jgi:1-acyl-sn-glycerol-3-phosphate acyltransferase
LHQGSIPPRYPFPWRIGFALLKDALLGRSRTFRADALDSLLVLEFPPKILQPQNIPEVGPALVVTNHYSRPGFAAWWIALAISAAMPVEVHWLMTNAWTHLGPMAPASRWLFLRLARVYGFTPTPPMPPNPTEIAARAQAVRQVLRVARNPGTVIGLAPEGRDQPGGILGAPPAGSGRFIRQLAKYCHPILPVGVFEDQDGLCLRCGSPFELAPATDCTPLTVDGQTSRQVMDAIARQLPKRLRGAYGAEG